MPNKIKTNPADFRVISEAGFQLLSLYKHNRIHTMPNGKVVNMGKVPKDKAWVTRPFDNDVVIGDAEREGNNVGVRLKPEDVVLDIDPRNGGNKGFALLKEEMGIDFKNFPRVVTGSGGLHIYAHKPPNVLVMDTLERWPGVEFKSFGRQVVAPGSIHPGTKKLYRFSDKYPALSEGVPMIPGKLLRVITRPDRTSAVIGGGQFDQEQIAAMLCTLNVEDFAEESKWFRLMQSVHHASNGDARDEFIEWSIRGNGYEGDSEAIGRRWDSLKLDKTRDPVTYNTLLKFVRTEGDADSVPRMNTAQDDFREEELPNAISNETPKYDFDTDDNEPAGEEVNGELAGLNETHCALMNAGRFCVAYREHKDFGWQWSFAREQDFVARYENRRLQNFETGPGKRATVTLGQAWLGWGDRKTADGTTLDPTLPPTCVADGVLNLWAGFGIEPAAGGCEHFKAMIRDSICDGDNELWRYILRWVAFKLQNPGELPEVSMVLMGDKGTGKTTFGSSMKEIFGEHGMVASSIDQITGKFNGYLETKAFVYADEAVWGGDKRNEASLKKLITDREMTYEYKGLTHFTGRNRVGLVVAGNAEWTVPASLHERRWCITRTSSKFMVPDGASADHPNRLYWNRVHSELKNGGLAAFLHEMLNTDIGKWHPRTAVPQTAALAEQKARGLSGVAGWWQDVLMDGVLLEENVAAIKDWSIEPLRATPEELRRSCIWHLRRTNPHVKVSLKEIYRDLKEFGVETGKRMATRSRNRYCLVPPLDEARNRFAKRIGFNPFVAEA